MSLRTVLISLIVAGCLAGLVILTRAGGASNTQDAAVRIQTIGVDSVSVVEIRLAIADADTQKAIRVPQSIDDWNIQLNADSSAVWIGDSTRIRTVLRALCNASLAVLDEEPISQLAGTMTLIDQDRFQTELRFDEQAVGGYVRTEIVKRGTDGLATSRWFGRVERTLRDRFLSNGFADWRSLDLFPMTIAEIRAAEFQAGGERVVLRRDVRGWSVNEPWNAQADQPTVQSMLSLTLGLKAERFYNTEDFQDSLTGLDTPIAEISVESLNGESTEINRIVIGSAVDSSGQEVFARYSINGQPTLVAIRTEGLRQLTAAPLAYIHQSPAVFTKANLQRVEIRDIDGRARFATWPRLDSWETDRGNTTGAVSESEAKSIDRLVQVLGSERARQISEREASVDSDTTDSNAVGLISLLLQNGEEIVFEASIESVQNSLVLHLAREIDGTSIVWSMNSESSVATAAWITALGSVDDTE